MERRPVQPGTYPDTFHSLSLPLFEEGKMIKDPPHRRERKRHRRDCQAWTPVCGVWSVTSSNRRIRTDRGYESSRGPSSLPPGAPQRHRDLDVPKDLRAPTPITPHTHDVSQLAVGVCPYLDDRSTLFGERPSHLIRLNTGLVKGAGLLS